MNKTKNNIKYNLHDENFKHNFSRKEVAIDFFRHNLPKEILEELDLATLQVAPNELLPSTYRNKRSADIIYSVSNKQGKKLYTLLHLEAQSTHKKDMAIRIWEYHVAIATTHLKKGYKKVPTILTLVLYHGRENWSSFKSVADLFENFDTYVASLKKPFLVNLTKKQLQELQEQGASSAPQIILKQGAEGDYCPILGKLYALMKTHNQVDEDNLDYMATLDKHGEHGFLEKLSKFDPVTANKYKIMFEAAIKRESVRALELGEQLGIEARNKQMAKQMLAKNMKVTLIQELTGLTAEQITD